MMVLNRLQQTVILTVQQTFALLQYLREIQVRTKVVKICIINMHYNVENHIT